MIKDVVSVSKDQEISKMTPDEALCSQLVLAILEALHNKGIKQVSKATLLELIGFDEDEITFEDHETILCIEDKYLQSRDEVLAVLQSRVAIKH